jgi:hypothetical protein
LKRRKRRAPALSFCILAVTAILLASCSKKSESTTEKQAPAEKKEPESRVSHDTNGNAIVSLDAATQQVIGLQTTQLKAASLPPEVKAFGRVMDISTLGGAVADLATTQAAAQASQAELERVKSLAAQTNASVRALQAAEAAAVHDKTQVDAVRLRLMSTWGAALASRSDLPALLQSLGSLKSALIELELPAGESLPQPPTGARIVTLSKQTQPAKAEFIGPSPAVDAQIQGRGFMFLAQSNSLSLAPGAAVTGYLEMAGQAQAGVAVPSAAIVRQNGATWVYVQTSDDKFQRTEVTLERPLEDGWFVQQGLKPEDKVVTAGAQQLLSQELKGGD